MRSRAARTADVFSAGRLDEKEPVPAHFGKVPQEILLADEQIALEDAVAQQADDLQLHATPAVVGDVERFADAPPEVQ